MAEDAAIHQQALEDEIIGVRHRMENFYLPLFRRFCSIQGLEPAAVRVLDCGCGAGVSVETLAAAGFRAYGIDLGGERREQWAARTHSLGGVFAQADAIHLPFADASFDIVLSCGLLEHIGMREGAPSYREAAAPNQAEQRQRFLGECLRVLRRPGVLYLDHPNGAFPVDFWHNDAYGRPRWHRPSEPFLPCFREVRDLVKSVDPACRVEALSPAGRFTFRRTGRRWYGSLLRPLLALYFELLRYRPLSWLARSALNPYLVIRVRQG